MIILLFGSSFIAVTFYSLYTLYQQIYPSLESTEQIKLKDFDPDQRFWSDSEESEDEERVTDLAEFSESSSEDDSEKDDHDVMSSSVSESNELRKVRQNRIRPIAYTNKDLVDWGIISSIDKICDQIGEQLKQQCIEDLKNKFLDNPDYRSNPLRYFKRLSRKRGPIKDLNIPQDLPIVALHKLHETPDYLSQVYQDRQNLHQQILREIKNKIKKQE